VHLVGFYYKNAKCTYFLTDFRSWSCNSALQPN